MGIDKEISANPFESLRLVIKVLVIAGFYETQSTDKFVRACHYTYRIIVIFGIIAYNMVHILFIFMTHSNVASITYGLIIEIPQINLFAKAVSNLICVSRIRKLHEVINDPIFSATNEKDEEYLRKNNILMLRMTKFSIYSIASVATMWSLSFVIKRIENPAEAIVPVYLPFDTTTTLGYAISVFVETGLILWTGHGHLMADIVIAVYYSIASTQLRILKYNLEHIFDSDGVSLVDHETSEGYQYIDEVNPAIRQRFIYFVERYTKVTWLIEETSSIFDRCVSCQLLSSTITSCLVIYQLSMMNIVSMDFLHLFLILSVLQLQILLYCYFGYLVEYESQSINTAVYFSEWVSASPRFRRDVLLAMTRWDRPLTPRVSTIIPVSVVTFVSIVKSSYKLYTMMKSTHL